MTDRRIFINQVAMAAGAIFIRPLSTFAGTTGGLPSQKANRTLTILHTAGLDGQWLPLENPHPLHGLGGLANLQKKIQLIKKQCPSPLLIQSGNIAGQRCTREDCSRFYKAVGTLDFDVIVPGIHDLAQGKDVFISHANENGLPVSLFRQPASSGATLFPSVITVKNAVRIGIINVNRRYTQAAETLSRTAGVLKAKKCMLVICVVEGNTKACATLAALSESVDVMLTTEEITSLHTTKIFHNRKGQEVVLSSAGSKGTLMNRLDFTFNEKGEKTGIASRAVLPGSENEEYASISKRCALFNA